jgi:hypothetical protein
LSEVSENVLGWSTSPRVLAMQLKAAVEFLI